MLNFENLKIANCPWGIQRKICILQSLIGDLPMVLMDEPSAGIDIMTKHALCEILQQIREMGRTVLVTTDRLISLITKLCIRINFLEISLTNISMREAEAMCLRVGILANGQFTAIGSCENLKAKHGRNFIMTVKVVPGFQLENLEKMKKIIDETFPSIKFKESYLVNRI